MSTKNQYPYFFERFPEDLDDWIEEQKAQGNPGSQNYFAEKIIEAWSKNNPDEDCKVDFHYVSSWKNGKNGVPRKYMKEICEVLKVPKDRYMSKTKDEKYASSSDCITEIGKNNRAYAMEIGLNLDLVRELSKLVDFDQLFPLYTPLRKFKREVRHKDSAPIDSSLRFLQIKRNGETYTMHKADLMYLKEVQDKIVNFVKYLFYDRLLEMESEEELFLKDINTPTVTLNGNPLEKSIQEQYMQIVNNPKYNIPDNEYSDELRAELTQAIQDIGIDTSGEIEITYPELTEVFIVQHDRFAKCFDEILPKVRKATQKDIDAYFKKGGKNNG